MPERGNFPESDFKIIGINSLTRIKHSLFKGEVIRMICQYATGHPMDTWSTNIKVVGLELANKFGNQKPNNDFIAEVVIWDKQFNRTNRKIYFNTKTRQGGVIAEK